MPTVEVNGIKIYYEQKGSGDPLILIPYLAADNTCYAYQVPEYAKHFTCITLDLRGTGFSDKPDGDISIELYADDVAAFMDAIGISEAHISGLSLGAAIGMWLAAKYPDKVKTLSLHSAWAKTDLYLQTVVEGWQSSAKGLNSVTEMAIRCIFPWCLTPELYVKKPVYIEGLAGFVRTRPKMSVVTFMKQSNAVIAHDFESQLGKITAPTLITFGRRDQLTSQRFADKLKNEIRNSEVVIFEDCSHAAIYERIDEFNAKTLEFLKKHSQSMSATV
jgi:pimeloyl-ACP methyl ester carboxylesterase